MKTGKFIPYVSSTSFIRNIINSSLQKVNSNIENLFESTKLFTQQINASSNNDKTTDNTSVGSTVKQETELIQTKPQQAEGHEHYEKAMNEWISGDEKKKETHDKDKKIKEVGKIALPSLTKSQIESRTKHLINCLDIVKSPVSASVRIQELCKHLIRYPEASEIAVKHGAIGSLLKLRETTKDKIVKANSRQALTLIGYADPPKGNGIRILSIDGGGTRGVVIIQMLRQIEKLSGKSINELFDMICGVSTGAIIAMLIGALQVPINKCEEFYYKFSNDVFKSDVWRGAGRLIWSHAYYDTKVWEKTLKDLFGEMDMIETSQHSQIPKLLAISAVINMHTIEAFLFRNYNLPSRSFSYYQGSSSYKVWQAIRASAAAPGYFEEFTLGNKVHQDGGILINNPTALAVQEAKLLWPNQSIQCVVSLGTGKYIPPLNISSNEIKVSSTSLKTKISRFIDSATDTEMVHRLMHDLLPDGSYHRLNPNLSEITTIDENRIEKLEQMKMDTEMYMRKYDYKLKQAIKDLCRKRSKLDQVQDWIKLQSSIMMK